jgi:hypothetical protein
MDNGYDWQLLFKREEGNFIFTKTTSPGKILVHKVVVNSNSFNIVSSTKMKILIKTLDFFNRVKIKI